jgi:hypothetical protein
MSTNLGRVVFPAIAAAVLALLAGCGTNHPAAGGPTITPTVGPGPAVPGPQPPVVATKKPTKPTTPPPPAGPGYPTTARAYAEATVAAWSGHNLDRLADLTTAGVHEQFVEIPGQLRTDWLFLNCDGAAGSNYCTLRNGDGDTVRLRVVNQYLGGPDAVRELVANLTTYPANGETYAREFVRAWATGNTPRMRALARPDVVVAVNNAYQDRPTGTWALGANGEHGGAGLLIVEIDINEGAIHYSLHVGTTLLGGKHAVVGYEP